MECLKLLVVLLAVFQGLLARPRDEVKLRAVVEELGRLARRMKDTEGSPSLPDPRGTKRPPGPISPNQMLLTLIDNYYGDFPNGNYTWDMPMDRNRLVELYNWFKNANFSSTPIFQSPIFSKIAATFMDSYFRCAAMKINQMVFYVLQEQENAMASEKELTMFTEIRRNLDGKVTDPSVLSREIITKSHAHTYDTIMRRIKLFRFKEMERFFWNMRTSMMKAVRKGWTDEELKSKFQELIETGDIFSCPDVDDLWEFHKKIAVYFQRRFSQTQPFAEAEAWLTNFLRDHVKNPAGVVQSILGVYRGYVTGAVGVFQQVEMHMTSENTDDILKFVSRYLSKEQLSYLESILRVLGDSDENEGDTDLEDTGSPDNGSYPGESGSPDDGSYPGDAGSPDDDSYPGGMGSPDDDLFTGGTGSLDDDDNSTLNDQENTLTGYGED